MFHKSILGAHILCRLSRLGAVELGGRRWGLGDVWDHPSVGQFGIAMAIPRVPKHLPYPHL